MRDNRSNKQELFDIEHKRRITTNPVIIEARNYLLQMSCFYSTKIEVLSIYLNTK